MIKAPQRCAARAQQCARRAVGHLIGRRANATRKQCQATTSSPEQAESPQVAQAKLQAKVFSQHHLVEQFTQPLPTDIEQRLADISSVLPGLNPSSRVLDVGSGTGCLLPHLQARGVRDILAVDLSGPMLQALQARFPQPSRCGNEPGVRTWIGDFLDLPHYMGPVDCICMNAVFGNFYSLEAALIKASTLLQPEDHVVISHPMGRSWHTQLHERDPQVVPHQLPDKQQWQKLLHGLPFELVTYRDEPELYVALLQVPKGYRFPGAPILLHSKVVAGFGRGSRQLGVPTANMDPGPLHELLQQLPNGVYCGWAQLEAPEVWPDADRAVHKMVMNVGRRPTVNAGKILQALLLV
eukprot:GHRR01033042.1.p1 GENE.GHRR01033042.1~~GHRR01033042.1.p1  ORF type:complete len:353 (+),score=100.97 GHRR01033042.1:621-1679(+)